MPQQPAKLSAFPVFVRVEQSAVVIVGNGEAALAKARLVNQSAASLRIVANAPEAALSDWISANDVTHIAEGYTRGHLEGAALVFAASGDEELDAQVSRDARDLKLPVNAVDRPE